jgi:hypothetical protein
LGIFVMALIDAGYEVVFATPHDSKPIIDPISDQTIHCDGDEGAHQWPVLGRAAHKET